MNYCKLNKYDVANGDGVRVSLFVSGCRNYCKGCFNKAAWDFNYGEPFTNATVNEIIEALSPDYISGLTILGGEPFEPENQLAVRDLIREIHLKFYDEKTNKSSKTIWIYTGYTLESLLSDKCIPGVTDMILSRIDVLVDGKFDESLYDISLRFRGSSNQRIINMKSTFAKYLGSILDEKDSFIIDTIDVPNN